MNAFADTYADIYRQIFFLYRQIFFLYRQIFLSIGRYRVYLPIQGLSADSQLISAIRLRIQHSASVFIGIGIYLYRLHSTVGSYSSGPPVAGTVRTKSMGGFH